MPVSNTSNGEETYSRPCARNNSRQSRKITSEYSRSQSILTTWQSTPPSLPSIFRKPHSNSDRHRLQSLATSSFSVSRRKRLPPHVVPCNHRLAVHQNWFIHSLNVTLLLLTTFLSLTAAVYIPRGYHDDKGKTQN